MLRLLAGQFEVNAIGTELDLVTPGDASVGSHVYRLEESTVRPRGEDSFAGEPGKIDLPLDSILVSDPNPVSRQRPDFERFQHYGSFYHRRSPREGARPLSGNPSLSK